MYQSLSHSRWDCKYHLVFVPKYCKKVIFGEIRQFLGLVFHELACQQERQIVEGHLMRDHVYMCMEPLKYSVSSVVGFIKGKSAMAIARQYGGMRRNFVGQKFWARGYFVSTVGRDESMIREYIKYQEKEEERIE